MEWEFAHQLLLHARRGSIETDAGVFGVFGFRPESCKISSPEADKSHGAFRQEPQEPRSLEILAKPSESRPLPSMLFLVPWRRPAIARPRRAGRGDTTPECRTQHDIFSLLNFLNSKHNDVFYRLRSRLPAMPRGHAGNIFRATHFRITLHAPCMPHQ